MALGCITIFGLLAVPCALRLLTFRCAGGSRSAAFSVADGLRALSCALATVSIDTFLNGAEREYKSTNERFDKKEEHKNIYTTH